MCAATVSLSILDKGTLSSGLDSDEGASPSVSDSESVSSTRSSTPSLKIVEESYHNEPKKRNSKSNSTSATQQQRSTRNRSASLMAKQSPIQVVSNKKPITAKKPKAIPSKMLLRSSTDANKTRNKRRRTKSERNRQAGKPDTSLKVAGREEDVALDAEIDRMWSNLLEEKAAKNNLTATNVKNIIRQVINDNMVRKMIVQTVKCNKTKTDDNESSDGETFFEPTLTRAKTKELMEKQSPLWPIVATPVKTSETHMLINQDLPEDSSGDEEYVPKDNELHHSEDESGSITSHTSDMGSPMMPSPLEEGSLHRFRNLGFKTPEHEIMFKTPPPKLKPRNLTESAVGFRTRSKLPLTDTTIETLEMQLIPPDITTDMYDWGESDNEDYLAFLKDFLLPVPTHNENNDDEEADPEYNVMEEEEDHHDREEHRMDRAVKVTKKELNELVELNVAELFDACHLQMSSGDEIDDIDLMHQAVYNAVHSSNNIPSISATFEKTADSSFDCDRLSHLANTSFKEAQETSDTVKSLAQDLKADEVAERPQPNNDAVNLPSADKENPNTNSHILNNENSSILPAVISSEGYVEDNRLFSDKTMEVLKHQLQQHVQLLTQNYVLTANRDTPYFKNIAKCSKDMIMTLVNFSDAKGPNSVFTVQNLKPAWDICNSWPQASNLKSPIKKKILEERFMNDKVTGEKSDFPHKVIKLIAESPAFMYPHLLPTCYDLHSPTLLYFTKSEDCLIVMGLEQLKNGKYNTKEKAEIISELLLSSRNSKQVYHRIKNTSKLLNSKSILHNYVRFGEIPKPQYLGLSEKYAVAPKDQPPTKCPEMWTRLISRLTYQPQSSSNDSVMRKKKKSAIKRLGVTSFAPSKPKKSKTSKLSSDKELSQKYCPIDHSPDVTAVPIFNSNGTPGAYILIPNYAMQTPVVDRSPDAANESSKSPEENFLPENSCKSPLPMDETMEQVNDDSFDETCVYNSDTSEEDERATSARTRVYERVERKIEPVCASKNKIPFYIKHFGMLTDVELSDESETETTNIRNTPIELIDLECPNEVKDSGAQGDKPDNKSNNSQNSRNCDNKSETGGTRESAAHYSNSGLGGGGRGNGRDDDDEDKPKKNNHQSINDQGDSKKDEDTDDEDLDEQVTQIKRKMESPPSSSDAVHKSSKSSSKLENSGKPKKFKRSPAGPSKKRVSKYNAPSAEKLLEDVEQDFVTRSEVEDAFTDAFILKVQSTIEPKSPAIYNAFVQLLCDHGECPTPELQLYKKVALLLNDYPELVKEFGSMLNDQSAANDEVYDFQYFQRTEAEIHFMTLLKKWTADSPPLRNKILLRMKMLREDPKMSEKDVIDMADNLFSGNSVMIKAFQDLFPEVFRPQPIDSAMDFEEIDMELDNATDTSDDIHTELVKLPEETTVPATNTCPCACHMDRKNISYASRSKHCNKCSVKFQDGKVFVHNGRVMRPVNITTASPGSAKKIIAGTACVKCVQTSPKVSTVIKESPSPPTKKPVKVLNISTTETLVNVVSEAPTAAEKSPGKVAEDPEDLEEGEIVDEEEVTLKPLNPALSTKPVPINRDHDIVKTSSNVGVAVSTTANAISVCAKTASKTVPDEKRLGWTMDEDKLILTTIQAERTVQNGLEKLVTLIAHRTKEQIDARFVELIALLRRAVCSGEMQKKVN